MASILKAAQAVFPPKPRSPLPFTITGLDIISNKRFSSKSRLTDFIMLVLSLKYRRYLGRSVTSCQQAGLWRRIYGLSGLRHTDSNFHHCLQCMYQRSLAIVHMQPSKSVAGICTVTMGLKSTSASARGTLHVRTVLNTLRFFE